MRNFCLRRLGLGGCSAAFLFFLCAGCTAREERLRVLCAEATLLEFARMQQDFRTQHHQFATALYQLRAEASPECEDWRYDLAMGADKEHFVLSAKRVSKPEEWTVDQSGKLRATH